MECAKNGWGGVQENALYAINEQKVARDDLPAAGPNQLLPTPSAGADVSQRVVGLGGAKSGA
jgi:hypothetical protein